MAKPLWNAFRVCHVLLYGEQLRWLSILLVINCRSLWTIVVIILFPPPKYGVLCIETARYCTLQFLPRLGV